MGCALAASSDASDNQLWLEWWGQRSFVDIITIHLFLPLSSCLIGCVAFSLYQCCKLGIHLPPNWPSMQPTPPKSPNLHHLARWWDSFTTRSQLLVPSLFKICLNFAGCCPFFSRCHSQICRSCFSPVASWVSWWVCKASYRNQTRSRSHALVSNSKAAQ